MKNVLVIGDIMLDHYINIMPQKISQEAPVITFNYKNDYYSLGGCTNVCNYLSNLNFKVDLIGVIGKDANASILLDLFNNNISKKHIIKSSKFNTILKERYVSDNKQVFRIDHEELNNSLEEKVLKQIDKLNNKYDLILISDYRKGVITNNTFDKIIEYANKYNIKVICDPKDEKVKYHDVFLLKPNLKEIKSLVNVITDENIINYKKLNNIENLVLTMGSDGMKLFDKNNKVTHILANKTNVYDVTGAGDCVISYLAYSILNNYSILRSCELSNKAASIKVSKFGTQMVDIFEVLQIDNKIININDLEDICNKLHRNKKIVFTNGCYDILHTGHIHLLKEAKKLGDILILGLNSDSSIRRIKGKNRPIFNEKDRIELLSSIEYIDYIVVFDEDTPLNIIKKIKPDILVKGSDYKNKLIVGKKEVLSYNGKVVLIDLIAGKSTTNIAKQIEGM